MPNGGHPMTRRSRWQPSRPCACSLCDPGTISRGGLRGYSGHAQLARADPPPYSLGGPADPGGAIGQRPIGRVSVTRAPASTHTAVVSNRAATRVSLRPPVAGHAMTLEEWEADLLVHTAAEELGHALMARLYSVPAHFITTVRLPGRFLGYTYVGDTPEDFERSLVAAVRVITAEAGDIANRIIRVTPQLLALAAVAIDEPATLEHALIRLPADVAIEVRSYLARPVAEAGDHSDEQKVESIGRFVAGQERWEEFVSTCRATAWRNVPEFFPLLAALMPGLLRNRVWTGVDLEQAIAATGLEGPAT